MITGLYHFTAANSPLLVTMPHVGTRLDTEIGENLTAAGRAVADTDWHVDLLYNFLDNIGASVLKAAYSRTVIDLNRNPAGAVLYPGQSETGLCPLTSFAGQPLYRSGCAPDDAEIQRRKQIFWQPYHDKIRHELERIKAQFGYALLWDAHSIKSRVPRFFDGLLPDLNIGSAGGRSCADTVIEKLFTLAQDSHFSAVVNGRFKGGYITRHYGKPTQDIQAVQLEISQATYMKNRRFNPDKADILRPVLQAMMTCFKVSRLIKN